LEGEVELAERVRALPSVAERYRTPPPRAEQHAFRHNATSVSLHVRSAPTPAYSLIGARM